MFGDRLGDVAPDGDWAVVWHSRRLVQVSIDVRSMFSHCQMHVVGHSMVFGGRQQMI